MIRIEVYPPLEVLMQDDEESGASRLATAFMEVEDDMLDDQVIGGMVKMRDSDQLILKWERDPITMQRAIEAGWKPPWA